MTFLRAGILSIALFHDHVARNLRINLQNKCGTFMTHWLPSFYLHINIVALLLMVSGSHTSDLLLLYDSFVINYEH